MSVFCGNFIKYFLFLLCVIGSCCKSEDIITEKTISSSTIGDFNSTNDSFANYDTSLETAGNNSSEEITPTTVKPPEEPKLPEDLISQDVLLDPNIVLARLSRDLRGMNFQPYYGHSSNYWPSRRVSSKNFNKKYRGDNIKAPRIKIYPVFPGK